MLIFNTSGKQIEIETPNHIEEEDFWLIEDLITSCGCNPEDFILKDYRMIIDLRQKTENTPDGRKCGLEFYKNQADGKLCGLIFYTQYGKKYESFFGNELLRFSIVDEQDFPLLSKVFNGCRDWFISQGFPVTKNNCINACLNERKIIREESDISAQFRWKVYQEIKEEYPSATYDEKNIFFKDGKQKRVVSLVKLNGEHLLEYDDEYFDDVKSLVDRLKGREQEQEERGKNNE